MKGFQSREFKEIQTYWYGRLKDEGFDDIEDTNSPMEKLKSWHSFRFTHDDLDHFETRRAYYDRALEFLHSHSFESERDMSVWALHCEGVSIRNIALKLSIKQYQAHRVIIACSDLILCGEDS